MRPNGSLTGSTFKIAAEEGRTARSWNLGGPRSNRNAPAIAFGVGTGGHSTDAPERFARRAAPFLLECLVSLCSFRQLRAPHRQLFVGTASRFARAEPGFARV